MISPHLRMWTGLGALLSGLFCFVTISAATESIAVAVSVPPQAYFVEAVGGEQVQVQVAVPEDASPHTFFPTPRQVARMASARIYVAAGVEVELQLLPRLRAMTPDLVVVGEPATEHHDHQHHDHQHHDHPDPHSWLDPRQAAVQVSEISEALSALLPDQAAVFADRAAAEIARLDVLHAELATILLPYRGRELLVAHPAFGHLAAAYGLHQVAVEQDGHEPTPRQLGVLMQRDLRTLFVQPQVSRATVASLVRSGDVAEVELNPLARDYPANMRAMARAIAGALAAEDDEIR